MCACTSAWPPTIPHCPNGQLRTGHLPRQRYHHAPGPVPRAQQALVLGERFSRPILGHPSGHQCVRSSSPRPPVFAPPPRLWQSQETSKERLAEPGSKRDGSIFSCCVAKDTKRETDLSNRTTQFTSSTLMISSIHSGQPLPAYTHTSPHKATSMYAALTWVQWNQHGDASQRYARC